MVVYKFNNYKDIPGIDVFSDKIPIFVSQIYCDYLKDIKNHDTAWLAVIENKKVSYLLPFAVSQKIIFRKGYFLTGIISFEHDNAPEKEKEFLENVVSYIKENKLCDWIQQGPNWALFNTFPADSKAVRFGTYRITLKDKNEAELFKLIQKRSRQDVNHAIKNGIIIKKGQNFLNDCLTVINSTARKGNLHSLSINEAEKLLFYMKDNCKIYVSYKDDIAQSAAIFLCNKYCQYALYAGSISELYRGSNNYLFWEAIKDARMDGCCYFDFVGARINPVPGSKQERIQLFKKHFGSEFVEGYIWKMVITKWKLRIYQILLKFYFLFSNKKMKKDIIDQELEIQHIENTNTDN